MYTRYFGLTEAPFTITPNPRYLYMSELHREALAHLLYGLGSDGCMILLTGDIGTGKTTLCRCLLEQLPARTEVAVILNPRLTARELLKTICEEFGLLPGHGTASIKTYIDAINQHLLQAHAEDRTIALIIDEAQNLDVSVLEQLRLLTNLETTTRKLLRILLVGQPELRDMLERPELVQVNQRITSRYHLTPLQSSDVRNYIQHRLNVAGDNNAALFTEKAIRHAINLTGGIPRLINVLCDRALLGAYAVNADHVSLEIMKRAGQEIFPKKYQASRRRAKAATLAAATLALLAIPALVFLPDWLEREAEPKPPTVAEKKTDAAGPTAQKIVPAKQAAPEVPEKITAEKEAAPTPAESSDTMPADKTVAAPVPKAADSRAPAAEKATLPPATAKERKTRGASADTIPSASAPDAAGSLMPAAIRLNIPALAEHLIAVPPERMHGPGQETFFGLPGNTVRQTAPRSTTLPPVKEKSVTTIKVSAPLLVLKKAGPMPQKTAEELIAK